jgi:hypothetical protein
VAASDPEGLMALRVTAGVILLLGFVCNGLGRIVADVCDGDDVVQREIDDCDDTRFEGVKSLLPPHAVVGYLEDEGVWLEGHESRFTLVQYALVPRLLVRGAGSEWTVGNFTDPTQPPPQLPGHRLRLVRDFGNGVRLYRTESR